MRTCCVGKPVRREDADGEGDALAGVLCAIKVEAGAIGVLCARPRGRGQLPAPGACAISDEQTYG